LLPFIDLQVKIRRKSKSANLPLICWKNKHNVFNLKNSLKQAGKFVNTRFANIKLFYLCFNKETQDNMD